MFEMRVAPEEQQLRQFYGMPVRLVMKDGSFKMGRLTGCRGGRIILNGTDGDDAETGLSRSKHSRRNSRTRSRKAKDTPVGAFPDAPPEVAGGFGFAPFGPGPAQFPAVPRESVPLHAVDSVLIL
ncbi:hypothetical protein E5161_18150 [Cohnella pontilimi]|uniref:Uncharacterized protein n=1 Tax=Cohnella pontilimi TaxID=2564100 RepID=A0A4U0F6D4_9BACL|nr:hypothetical protein [Cohnella pontilimi]TJY39858.1 hypothetical protein E5161_18150 [Cohnella pontilimi]